ncbi:MAG: heme o synthase [Sulfuricella sp.]
MNTLALLNSRPWPDKLREFYALCKPRVTGLIVFTAVIGMALAAPGMVPLQILLAGTAGIAMTAGAAAALNCIVERRIDMLMARTCNRPLAAGRLGAGEALAFVFLLGGSGLTLLYFLVNPLTMLLTFATFVGYALVYTLLLKPATPLNIVIGGAAGAMPPVLGWAAVSGGVSGEALILFLIVFAWTPPHFWSLALYRTAEYAKAGVPMLPVTHGSEFTRLHIVLYTVMLATVSLMPYGSGMSGLPYLIAALPLAAVFLWYAVRLYRDYSDGLAQRTFRYSITYLTLLFAALLVDHYLH